MPHCYYFVFSTWPMIFTNCCALQRCSVLPISHILLVKKKHSNEVFIYVGLAILFQPLVKITLGRAVWNVIDLLVGVGLLLSLVSDEKNNKQIENAKSNRKNNLRHNVPSTETDTIIKNFSLKEDIALKEVQAARKTLASNENIEVKKKEKPTKKS